MFVVDRHKDRYIVYCIVYCKYLRLVDFFYLNLTGRRLQLNLFYKREFMWPQIQGIYLIYCLFNDAFITWDYYILSWWDDKLVMNGKGYGKKQSWHTLRYNILVSDSKILNSKNIFTLQKKIVRLMAGVKRRNSCRSLFKILEILALPCQYLFSLMNFILNNQEHF
jgi:hypothetical protein